MHHPRTLEGARDAALCSIRQHADIERRVAQRPCKLILIQLSRRQFTADGNQYCEQLGRDNLAFLMANASSVEVGVRTEVNAVLSRTLLKLH